MPLVTFYFQLHQPWRLDPEGPDFLWPHQNEVIFRKVAEKCYLPATRMFTELIKNHPSFRITLSMSGTFLEQARRYGPEVIDELHKLYHCDKEGNRVEFLQETFFHSLTGLFADKDKREFRDQVAMHRQLLRELFGARPTAFRNTELMYNNEIAETVADMGYRAILCEQRGDMYGMRDDKMISPNAVFRATGKSEKLNLIVLPRNRDLSDDVAFRFKHTHLSADDYADHLARVDGELVLLGYDYEHIGEHLWEDTGIFDFWRSLPAAIERHRAIECVNPSGVAERFAQASCPVVDIHSLATSSWADEHRDTSGWLGTTTQHKLFRQIEALEQDARRAGGDLYRRWQRLTTSDHLYYVHEGLGPDGQVHAHFSPYGSPAHAAYVLTRQLDRLDYGVHSFLIRIKPDVTPVVIITPETSRLPSEGMGQFAQYVSGKSGGMGEVVGALCKGLIERKIPTHLITLNLRRRFREQAHISDQEWVRQRHQLNPENLHLVSSAIYEDYYSAYEGDPLDTAADFQRQIINSYIKEIRSNYEGRVILHSHDWMAGGAIAAYAHIRGIPLLHTIHNTHTGMIPLDMLHGVSVGRLWEQLYLRWDHGRHCMDCQATAIKNATRVSFVGKSFLQELVEDYFMDQPIIPWSVRQEIKAKHAAKMTLVIPNGISPDSYPENQLANPNFDAPGLACCFGPDDDIVAAKRANLAKFQHQMGLKIDPNAILLYWPSRLDRSQKGVELLEQIAQAFVDAHPGVQIAVVGNPVGGDMETSHVIGRIACASQGRVAYHGFDENLCMLGYAAAHDVFGASLYEPFGQIDVVGNLFGATATNRATGGYRDKIADLLLKVWGAPEDVGNGVLFKDYDADGLWFGLHHAVGHHRYFQTNPDQWRLQMRRIMRQARQRWSMDNMIAGYMTAYETLRNDAQLP